MNQQMISKLTKNDGSCEGCLEEDCGPTYNEYSDLMLCDSCFQRAENERDNDYTYLGMGYFLNADGSAND